MPRPNDFLAILRSSLGVASLAELRDRPISERWFEAVGAAYTELSAVAPQPPVKAKTELRLVIGTSSLSPLDEAEVAARSLLLAPSVAVVLSDSINYARRLLRLATLLEPAIDEGLVLLLPESSISTSSYFDSALAQQYGEPPVEPRQREEFASAMVRRMEVAIAMDAAAHYPDRLDLALTSKAQVADVRDLLESMAMGSSPPATDRIRFLPELVTLAIPRLALAPDELLRLRRDGQFEDLRVGLTEALGRMSALDDEDVVDPSSVRVREIRDYLMEVTARSAEVTARSRFVRGATTGTLTVSVGAVSGALGSLGGPEAGAVVGELLR